MQVSYDPDRDVLRIVFREAPVQACGEDRPGVIVDYDRYGLVIGLEIMDASTRVEDPGTLAAQVTP